jgi:hypothetical protein
MFKNAIKSFVAAVLFATPVLAADATGTFTGQSPNGPVVLQLHPSQRPGVLAGELHCGPNAFAVVAQQQGDRMAGLFGAPGIQPMQFVGAMQNNGVLTLVCNGSAIQLTRGGQPAPAQMPQQPQQQWQQQRMAQQYQTVQPPSYSNPQPPAGYVYANPGYGQAYGNAGNGGYAYPGAYTPAPAVNYNHPNDGSAVMKQYERYQAAQDQMALQRSDTMRGQNRYVGPDGTEYTAPIEATQVTVDNTGQGTYSTEQAPTCPPSETVAQPYNYSAPAASGAAEGGE